MALCDASAAAQDTFVVTHFRVSCRVGRRAFRSLPIAAACVLALPAVAPAVARTSPHFTSVRVFDGTAGALSSPTYVLVGWVPSRRATVIDGTGRTLMPGLIEATHIGPDRNLDECPAPRGDGGRRGARRSQGQAGSRPGPLLGLSALVAS